MSDPTFPTRPPTATGTPPSAEQAPAPSSGTAAAPAAVLSAIPSAEAGALRKASGKEDAEPFRPMTLLCLVLGAWVLWAVLVLLLPWLGVGLDKEGQFGDAFGALNALFSGGALAGVVYAVLLQQRDLHVQSRALRFQRRELKLTREEVELQRKQMEEQTWTFQRDAFENTLFQLLQLHRDNVASLEVEPAPPSTDKSLKGRAAFRYFSQCLDERFFKERGDDKLEPDDECTALISAYEGVYTSHEALLGHYFRTLYHIFKFIDERGGDEQKMYSAFVRAQLSSYELYLLFHNGLGPYGREKFKRLIEEYALLEQLDPGAVLANGCVRHYKPEAWGDRMTLKPAEGRTDQAAPADSNAP